MSDNLILSHADRTRVIADDHRKAVFGANLSVSATFLVDGFVAGTWKIQRAKKRAVLSIVPFGKLARAVSRELAAEGEDLLRFAEPEAESHEVRETVRS